MQDIVHCGFNVPFTSVCGPIKSVPKLDARRVQPSDPTGGNKQMFVLQHFVEVVYDIDGEAH